MEMGIPGKRNAMSRIMLTSIGDVDEAAQLEPDPDLAVGPGELLVAMEAAAINLTDFRLASGLYTERVQVQPPQPMGTEGVGRVVEAGSAADTALVGKRVVILPTYEQGTWADRIVLPTRNVVPVGDGGDVRQLAMLAVNPATAYLLLKRYVSLQPGDWVGQDLGNSAMGQYVIGLAKHAGLKTLSVVRRPELVPQLEKLGADLVVVDGEDLRDRIADALGDARLRLVLDGVGGPVAGDLAHSLEFGGLVLSYSSLSRTPVAVPAADLVYRELSVRGFWLINWIRTAAQEEIQALYGELARLVERGVIASDVEASYPLADFRAAFDRARRPQRSGKVLFTFTG
jgi:NADPH:quinone reductase-like Zn-dependent oxidoreductase